MFNTIGKAFWANQVEWGFTMQTNPEQPIEPGKMVHMRMRYETMSNAQELAG